MKTEFLNIPVQIQGNNNERYKNKKSYKGILWVLILSSPFLVRGLNLIAKNTQINSGIVSEEIVEASSNVIEEKPSGVLDQGEIANEVPNEVQPALSVVTCPVAQSSEVVDNSYFDDVIFIGDSLTSGLQLYKAVKNAVIISETGLNIETILDGKIKIDGQETTVLDAVKQTGRKKVYIMIGANGAGWLDNDYMIKLYSKWLNLLREEIPDISIYVESVLPVTKELSDLNKSKKGGLTNEKINSYNEDLQKMCEQQGYYFLNVAEIFKDDKGALIAEASPVDGMHINSVYYNLWLEYIKSHVVK